jgi:hypothetical protein
MQPVDDGLEFGQVLAMNQRLDQRLLLLLRAAPPQDRARAATQ